MSTTTNQPQSGAVQQQTDRSKVTYQVGGQDVTLSYSIIRNYLTRGNGNVTESDLVQFISLCKFNQLNPFLNEAYLVKYGSNPASMIVSLGAYLKRADACPNYDGMQAGIIVMRDNKPIEIEGCFRGDKDVLVGGWAKVYRSDKKFPSVSKVNLSEYDKKLALWNEKKSTMISKIAKVQALREAFPSQLGSMYVQEEITKDVDEQTKDDVQKIGMDVPIPDTSEAVDKETGEVGEKVEVDSPTTEKTPF